MKFQVKAYDLQEVLNNCRADRNLNNLILQLNNRTVWILERQLKHGDIFEETDPYRALYLTNQFVNNTKTPWLVKVKEFPGISPDLPIPLTVDDQVRDYTCEAGQTVWVKFTPSYSDAMVFYVCHNGLGAFPNMLSNYTSYNSDHVTTNDISGGNAQDYPSGSGPDFQGRETWSTFLAYNYQAGQTYYVAFVVPLNGVYGMCLQGD